MSFSNTTLMMRFTFLLFFIIFCNLAYAQLVLNEVSQGESGAREFIEIVVMGDNNGCSQDSVDIRGWIIDDNNGWHAAGSGNGIAQGHMRFADVPQWEKVPVGSIIVVYNDGDRNPVIPADDVDDSNPKDCVYIVPANSTVLESNGNQPVVNGAQNYAGPYTAGGDWGDTGMANSDDSYQLVAPTNITTYYHAISWGSNSELPATPPNKIQFDPGAAGDVIYMTNAVNDDPFAQANWVKVDINYTDGITTNDETPGAGNTAANTAWIDTLKNGCMPFLPAVTPTDDEICEGESSSLTALGGGTYEWSNSDSNGNILVSPTVNETFTVTITSDYGCSATEEVPIIVHPNPEPIITGDTILCFPNTLTLDAGAPYTDYDWDPNGENSQTIMVGTIGDYTVTVTDTNNCTGTAQTTVTPIDLNFIRE